MAEFVAVEENSRSLRDGDIESVVRKEVGQLPEVVTVDAFLRQQGGVAAREAVGLNLGREFVKDEPQKPDEKEPEGDDGEDDDGWDEGWEPRTPTIPPK